MAQIVKKDFFKSLASYKNKTIKVAVIGIGGIGGILAALFSKFGHETYAVTSHDSSNAINKNGLSVSSEFFGTFKSYPIATENLNTDIDLIIFTTKFPYLRESLKRINPSAVGNPLYISLLNGLGSRDMIMEYFGSNFLNGSIGSIEVFRDKDGIIKQPSYQKPVISLSKEDSVTKDCFKEALDAFESVGVSTETYSNYNEVIWNKLVRLGAIASSTAAFKKSIGEIIENENTKTILYDLIDEGSLLANKLSVNISASEVKSQTRKLPYNLTTSLSRDLREGRPSELDSITAAIVEKGNELRIETPTYDYVLELIRRNNEL